MLTKEEKARIIAELKATRAQREALAEEAWQKSLVAATSSERRALREVAQGWHELALGNLRQINELTD